MRFRWEYIAGGLGLLLAVGLALSSTGVGTFGTWGAEATSEAATQAAADAVETAAPEVPFGAPSMTADELAQALMAGVPGTTVVDVRDTGEAPADRIAVSYWLPLDDEAWEGAGPFGKHRKLIIVAEGDAEAQVAWRKLAAMDYDHAVILAGGMPAWTERYGDPQEPAEGASREQWEDYSQRMAVALYLTGGVDALTAGAATGAPSPVAAPPPLPVRTTTSGPKAAEGC